MLNDQKRPSAPIEFVASDLEGTLTAGEAWRGLRAYLETHRYKQLFRRFYIRKLPRLILLRAGKIKLDDFKVEWMAGILDLFADFHREEFEEAAAWVVEEELWPKRRQAVLDELHAHQENGRRPIIVTGLFEPLLQVFAEKAGGLAYIGTPIAYEGDRLTGKTAVPFNLGPRKVASLQPYIAQGKLYAAYGDTAPDIPMLEISEHPTAVHPDQKLRETAVARGWHILE